MSGSGTDNAWGQGDKSDCFLAKTGGVNGACVTQVNGIGASKTDLQYHGIGLAKGVGGDDYLYSGIKRLQAGGITSSNANYNVEVNQLLDAYKPGGPDCPARVPGHRPVQHLAQPGRPDIHDRLGWQSVVLQCRDAGDLRLRVDRLLDRRGQDAKPGRQHLLQCISGTLLGTPPWRQRCPERQPRQGGRLDQQHLRHPALHVLRDRRRPDEVGPRPAGRVRTFKNVWAHSRSSSSSTAELKDFIFGQVSISTCTATTTVLRIERTSSAGTTDVAPANNAAKITVNPGAYVDDVASVTGTSPTGSVAFTYYPTLADCTNGTNGVAAGGGTLSSGSSTSSTVQFNTAGTFYWQAVFTGTSGTSNSSSACGDEVLTVRLNTQTVTTLHERTNSTGDTDVTPSNNDHSITVSPGAWVNDTVGVTPTSATGSVAFTYYPTLADCTNKTNGTAAGGGAVSSGSSTSNTVQFNTAGTFYWQAVFTGTGTTNGSSSTCGDEILTVRLPTQTVTTLHERTDSTGLVDVTPSNNHGSITVLTGAWVNDTVGVTPTSATGSAAFTYYPTLADCTNKTNGVAAGGGTVSSGSATSNTVQFNSVGTFYWQAVFTGTGTTNSSSSTCGDES